MAIVTDSSALFYFSIRSVVPYQTNSFTMANNPKLRAGKGAKATILTKMIRPNNVAIPHEKHRSTIIITDYFEEKGKYRLLFR